MFALPDQLEEEGRRKSTKLQSQIQVDNEKKQGDRSPPNPHQSQVDSTQTIDARSDGEVTGKMESLTEETLANADATPPR